MEKWNLKGLKAGGNFTNLPRSSRKSSKQWKPLRILCGFPQVVCVCYVRVFDPFSEENKKQNALYSICNKNSNWNEEKWKNFEEA